MEVFVVGWGLFVLFFCFLQLPVMKFGVEMKLCVCHVSGFDRMKIYCLHVLRKARSVNSL